MKMLIREDPVQIFLFHEVFQINFQIRFNRFIIAFHRHMLMP